MSIQMVNPTLSNRVRPIDWTMRLGLSSKADPS